MRSVVIHTVEEQTVYFYQTWVTRPGEARRKEMLCNGGPKMSWKAK